MDEVEKERRFFRSLFKLLFVVGILVLLGKMLAAKKDEYYGLTESEARSKFESKLGPRIGEDKATEIADQVIPVLKDKGIIKADAGEAAVDAAAEAVADAADEAAEKVKEAVDKVTAD